MKKDFKVYKSEEGRHLILSYYRKLLKNVEFAYRERYVNTTFGKTYVLEAGDPGKPAVVLIHGSCSNSAAWFGDIPILTECFHVFSVDIVGDAGSSDENRLDKKKDQFECWLKDVFDELGIGKAILIGNSLGGWISLKFAVAYPERTEKLVLIAPAGIARTKPSFVFKTILYLMAGEKGRRAMMKLIFGADEIPEEVYQFTKMVGENFNPMVGAMPALTDEQLRGLKIPVLYVAGENDATADVPSAALRLKKLVPAAEIRVVENNGHVIYDAMKRADEFCHFSSLS